MAGLLRPRAGRVLLDGVSLSAVQEEELRQALCVIPQHPHLFGGTVRFNLDPVQKHSDDELWAAIRRVHAEGVIARMPAGLDTPISGISLSAGEARQLLCYPRPPVISRDLPWYRRRRL